MMKVTDAAMGLNYGIEKVRFTAPVPVGSEVRLKAKVVSSEPRGEGILYRLGVEIEIKGQDKPAMVGEVLYLHLLSSGVRHVIDHVILNVSDYDASRAFYEAALAPLGFSVGMEFPGFCGFDRDGKPWFWIAQRPETTPGHARGDPRRQAGRRSTRSTRRRGRRRPRQRPARPARALPPGNYYAAFALDPDGNNIEAVTPTSGSQAGRLIHRRPPRGRADPFSVRS